MRSNLARSGIVRITIIGVAIGTCLMPATAAAALPQLPLGEGGASLSARMIQLFLLITVLSLAPGILVMATSFVRLVVVFSLLRSAIGLQQAPPNMVLVSLALFLTAFIMAPTFETAWAEGVAPMLAEEIDQETGIANAIEPFRTFMARQADPEDVAFFLELAESQGLGPGEAPNETEDLVLDEAAPPLPPLHVLLPAFMISELSRAFEIGFLVMMPFLVIDLAVAAILMSMGMMMLPPQTVSLSMKLIFFVLIDGWRLLSESLVQSFF
jgi:flagellar biosynthetic protein FliP